MNPYLATLFTFIIAVLFLRLMDYIAHRGWIESRLSRKFIHIGTGPIFVLCWLMFPDLPISRWLAALVPLVITAQFALVGTGMIKDEAAVKAMSRTGDRREILRGPLFYGIGLRCGDADLLEGFADWHPCSDDDVRRRWDCRYRRTTRQFAELPWSPEKSVVGSLSVFTGRLAADPSYLCCLYRGWVFFSGPFTSFSLPVTWIALGAMLVEFLPFKDVDNITLTVLSALIGHLVF